MRELSLHILDLAQNSIEAGAHNVIIEINENENGFFVFRISDDGHGIHDEMHCLFVLHPSKIHSMRMYIWNSPAGGVDGCFVNRVAPP